MLRAAQLASGAPPTASGARFVASSAEAADVLQGGGALVAARGGGAGGEEEVDDVRGRRDIASASPRSPSSRTAFPVRRLRQIRATGRRARSRSRLCKAWEQRAGTRRRDRREAAKTRDRGSAGTPARRRRSMPETNPFSAAARKGRAHRCLIGQPRVDGRGWSVDDGGWRANARGRGGVELEQALDDRIHRLNARVQQRRATLLVDRVRARPTIEQRERGTVVAVVAGEDERSVLPHATPLKQCGCAIEQLRDGVGVATLEGAHELAHDLWRWGLRHEAGRAEALRGRRRRPPEPRSSSEPMRQLKRRPCLPPPVRPARPS